jgi:ADP-ribosylglycohydrolase
MNEKYYRKKVMGCWLGKAVGGTLGQPYEGCDGPLNLNYYEPVPTDMIPNDDLDLQVLWACVLNNMVNPVVDRDVLAQAWLNHVDFPWDEYGIAIRNLKMGIPALLSGNYDNWFKDGLGAAIRSEIWACLAPGKPELAAKYAYEDACVDHTGDGIYAEQFLAALESTAFIENDIDRLLDTGLSVIPADSRLASAITDTQQWCEKSDDWLAILQQILNKWGNENFTDAVMNIPFAVMALLLGKGDFSKTICLSVNCGRDADCTTATVGAILGIINPDCIGEKWLKPIGRKLVLNDGITGIDHPDTLDDFTDMVISLRERVTLRKEQSISQIDLSKYAIKAECGIFSPWFPQDENKFAPKLPIDTQIREFQGCNGSIDATKVPPDSLYMMRFKFKFKKEQFARIMFNTPANSRVWIDGKYAFGREGGRMAPSFHRCPKNQYKDMKLHAGKHEILVGVTPVNGKKMIDWVIGIGDVESKQWMADIFWGGNWQPEINMPQL